MWGVPRRESSAETVTLSRHDTEQPYCQCWTRFYTDTRSEFLTHHHGCYNFTATCHGQFYTHFIFGGWVWVGFTYVVLNSKAHFNMSCCCVCLCCFCSGSNASGFRECIKRRTWRGPVCQRNFVLLSDDTEIPLGATKRIFKSEHSGAACPPLLIALTSLAYCLIQSHTSRHIFHLSTGPSHVGIKQGRMQGTEESLMQKAETLVHLDRILLEPSTECVMQGKVRIIQIHREQ